MDAARSHHIGNDLDGLPVTDRDVIAEIETFGSSVLNVSAADRRSRLRWMTWLHNLGAQHDLRLTIQEHDQQWVVLDLDWDVAGQDDADRAARVARAGERTEAMMRHPSNVRRLRLVDDSGQHGA